MESDTPRITERGVATLPGEAWELARLPGAVAGYVCQGGEPAEFGKNRTLSHSRRFVIM